MDDIVSRSMQQGTKQDHYHSVLSRMVTAVSQDHSQLRTLIYEFARRKLRKDLFRHFEDGDWPEIERQLSTLEAAINEVELDYKGIAALPPAHGTSALTFGGSGNSAISPIPLRPISEKEMAGDYGRSALPDFLTSAAADVDRPPPIITVTEYSDRSATARLRKFNFGRTLELVLAALLGFGIYSAFSSQDPIYLLTLHRFGSPVKTSAPAANDVKDSVSKPEPKVRFGVTDLPLPSSYGVYAVINGQLTSLDTLPIRVPDPRVAVSAMIATPSRAHLPHGQIQFIVYRRDLTNDAPDRVSLRVVAQVVRALAFDPKGKPAYTDVDQSWVVRDKSYQMSVSPVSDNPEMIVIRPDPATLILPAGRYALVLKSNAFDFTVDGPIPDAAHCLERTETAGASFYSECPKR